MTVPFLTILLLGSNDMYTYINTTTRQFINSELKNKA